MVDFFGSLVEKVARESRDTLMVALVGLETARAAIARNELHAYHELVDVARIHIITAHALLDQELRAVEKQLSGSD